MEVSRPLQCWKFPLPPSFCICGEDSNRHQDGPNKGYTPRYLLGSKSCGRYSGFLLQKAKEKLFHYSSLLYDIILIESYCILIPNWHRNERVPKRFAKSFRITLFPTLKLLVKSLRLTSPCLPWKQSKYSWIGQFFYYESRRIFVRSFLLYRNSS